MPLEFTVSATVNATPRDVYESWLDGPTHAEMTGSPATCSAEVGGEFSAWDGYIRGTLEQLEPSQRIVQRWRTSDFDQTDEDSLVDITFSPAGHGTLITLHHSNIPDGLDQYEQGWATHYFEPMKRYFSARASY